MKVKIDNITANLNIGRKINLMEIRRKYENSSYNPERFPALFLKTETATGIIFYNGKVNIVGCKSLHQLEKSWREILEVVFPACIIL